MGLAVLQLRAALVCSAFGLMVALSSAVTMLFFWWIIIPAFLLAELLVFPCIFLLKYWNLNRQPLAHVPPPGYNPRSVFDRFTKDQAKLSKYLCIKDMLTKWFWNVPISEIKKGNVADLLTYGFWYKSREQLTAEGQGHLPDQLVQEIEDAWGVSFEPGHNKDLTFMSHLWQDLRCLYRPMSFYLGIEALFLMKHLLLLGTGFQAHSHRGYTFYSRGMDLGPGGKQRLQAAAAAGPAAGQAPILFLHGVGLGLLPYATFILRLAATQQPMLAIESNHLGMRWVPYCPSEDEVVDAIVEILDQCGVSEASVVAHSYGTFMASRLVQRFPQRIQSLVLIDPVCFVMFSGKLILNFVYEPHKSAITTWFVARDIHHSASVCRNFFWSLLNLWPEHLPAKTLVVLSGKDELVPVKETITMLEAESSAQILYHDHHCHAEFIKDLAWQDKVVENVVRMARHQEDPMGPAATKALRPEHPADGGLRPPASGEPSKAGAGGREAHHVQESAEGKRQDGAAANGTARIRTARARQHGRTDSASSWKTSPSSVQPDALVKASVLPVLH